MSVIDCNTKFAMFLYFFKLEYTWCVSLKCCLAEHCSDFKVCGAQLIGDSQSEYTSCRLSIRRKNDLYSLCHFGMSIQFILFNIFNIFYIEYEGTLICHWFKVYREKEHKCYIHSRADQFHKVMRKNQVLYQHYLIRQCDFILLFFYIWNKFGFYLTIIPTKRLHYIK